MIHYLLIFVAAVFVNNVVFSQFLGICPFLGVSKKIDTALGMGAAVTFVLALSTMCTFLLQRFILEPLDMVYMQTISFILVIAALVQMVEIILKKVSPALYQALGVFLPLITTNCCVLGVAILVIQKEFNLLESVVYAVSIALGFTLALAVFAGIREQLARTQLPPSMKGIPIALISAGKNNRYKHPHQETLDRFKNIQTQIFRTDEQGAIRFSGWGSWEIETVK